MIQTNMTKPGSGQEPNKLKLMSGTKQEQQLMIGQGTTGTAGFLRRNIPGD